MLTLQRARAIRAEADLQHSRAAAIKDEEDLARTRVQLAETTEECQQAHRKLARTTAELARHLTRAEKDRAITARCIDTITRAAQDTEAKVLQQHGELSRLITNAKASVAEDIANLSWSPHVTAPPVTTSTQRGTPLPQAQRRTTHM